MSASSVPTSERNPEPASVPAGATRDSAAEIDASLRWPVLALSLGSAVWLLVGLVFAIIGSIKLHAPGFFADSVTLTAGRIRPAAMNALVYGFASQSALAVSLWILSRLGGNRFAYAVPVVIAAKLWNLGVLVGVWAILAGASTGFELLEMPRYASPLLFIAFVVIALCAVASFWARRERDLYPSQWFLLGSLFWFPWLYSAANLLLVINPVRGTMQAVVNAWYVNGLLGLWLGSVALAVVFYFLPKLSGRPLFSAPAVAFGFWSWAVLTGFSGLTSLIGGPVPRWLPALSTAATLASLAPLATFAFVWYRTLAGGEAPARGDTVLRFIIAAAVCFLIAGAFNVVLAFPQVAAVTNLTLMGVGLKLFVVLGFVGMALLGGIYYILPRVLGADWPNAQFVRGHFLCTIVGVALIFGPLALGGILQGIKINNPSVEYVSLARSLTPWIGLSSLGFLWLLAGQVLMFLNFMKLLRGWCSVQGSTCATWFEEARPVKAGGRP